MGCSPPGSSVHGIFQARMLEWVAISFSRGSSRLRDWIPISCLACGFFTIWDIREALSKMATCTSVDGGTRCFWEVVAIGRSPWLHHVGESREGLASYKGRSLVCCLVQWFCRERSGMKANDVCISSVVLDQQHQHHLRSFVSIPHPLGQNLPFNKLSGWVMWVKSGRHWPKTEQFCFWIYTPEEVSPLDVQGGGCVVVANWKLSRYPPEGQTIRW